MTHTLTNASPCSASAIRLVCALSAAFGLAGCNALVGGDDSGNAAQGAQAGAVPLAECNGEYEITTTIRLNMRADAGVQNRILQQAAPGSRWKRKAGTEAKRLRRDNRCGAPWLPVDVDGTTMWICGQPAWVKCIEAEIPAGEPLTCDEARAVTACGGALRGTYEAGESCAPQTAETASPFGSTCPAATQQASTTTATTYEFSGGARGTMTQHTRAKTTGTVDVPRTCLATRTCDDFLDLLDNGTSEVSCAELGAGDIGCRCTFTSTEDIEERWAYQTAGSTLKLAKASDASITSEVDYCVQGSNLVMWEGSQVAEKTATSCANDAELCYSLGVEFICDTEFNPPGTPTEGVCLQVTSATTAEPYHRAK